jgi:hypothetical protein
MKLVKKESQPMIRVKFKSQVDILKRLREAYGLLINSKKGEEKRG